MNFELPPLLRTRTLVDPLKARNQLLAQSNRVSGSEWLPIAAAAGRCLAEVQVAGIALPRFDNSAVDGFGIHVADMSAAMPLRLKIVAGIHAGDQLGLVDFQPGTALRILTGAVVPFNLAAVVPEEAVQRDNDALIITKPLNFGANIRRRGEDVAPGLELLRPGVRLDARHLALLAATGIRRVQVVRQIRVGVLSTGNELVEPGDAIAEGRIADTNRPMLLSALAHAGLEPVDLGIFSDKTEVLAQALHAAAPALDLVITSGGVFGSEADHLARALLMAGGTCTSLHLALRPGKPMAFGRLRDMQVLGLPGNPVAALIHYVLFVRPVLALLAGIEGLPDSAQTARTSELFRHKPGRTEMVPAKIVGHDAMALPLLEKLGRGGSARLLPLTQADGLAEMPADVGDMAAGTLIRFYPFAGLF
ncbi:MAG: molybdopterin molybdotransferase MoeA [Hyphomicrobiales bacterium]|nr:molybdopterin molybdotransferase MoeA [Hyphomicrobiales bacterium]MDE2115923.1 molybdopterin molybdotransferase MoeA [Hyphomicrobiales bacterium]